MKKVLLIHLLFCLTVALHGQNYRQREIDSLTNMLTENIPDTARIDIHTQLGHLWFQTDAVKAVEYLKGGLKIAENLQDENRIVGTKLELGWHYNLTGELPKAIELMDDVLNVTQFKNGFAHSMAGIFQAYNYKELGEWEKALPYVREGFREFETLDKNNPGFSFQQVGTTMSIAEIYEGNNMLDSAFYFITVAYGQLKQLKDFEKVTPFVFQIPLVKGNIYFKQHKLDSAYAYYQTGLAAAKKIQNSYGEEINELAIAKVEDKLSNTTSAQDHLLAAILSAQKTKNFPVVKEAGTILRRLFQQQGHLDKALYYADLANAAKDSLSGTEKLKRLQLFEINEKIDQQKRQQDLQNEKKAYENNVKYAGLIVLLVVVIIIAAILFRNNKQKEKANILLYKQKEEINLQRSRIEDALTNLKSTQAQLIQSEKMASLGELTAGIAHEIQNPLNFVNNFSEVSNELIDEMNEELDRGDIEEAKAISADIKQNLEKINHHGKRADAIVKGMLQHSRASSAVKEPTDINKLADEYLRLAFHGLRAKDKSFNATLKTEYDGSIGNISIVPQDMGRVILNLITNAFYAVTERAKSETGNYEPKVSITTKKLDHKVEINVTDNGNGIPQKVLDKIFQPFFTTKPTGQGTGLGLSLAYDIVKAHGGELTVETKVGLGSVFIIKLPTA